jgi:hypothetical protein
VNSFPIDWNEWSAAWHQWLTAHADKLGPTLTRFPGKNVLADEVLGTFEIEGRTVELSEVTFPNLSERDEREILKNERHRFVGICWEKDAQDSRESALAENFDELERLLGI